MKIFAFSSLYVVLFVLIVFIQLESEAFIVGDAMVRIDYF